MMRKRSSNNLARTQRELEQRSAALSRKIARMRKQAEENFQMVDEDVLEETIDEDLEDAGYGDAEELYEDEFEEDFSDFYSDSEDSEMDSYEVEMPESDSTMQSLTKASITIKKLAQQLGELSDRVDTLKNRKVASLKRKQSLNNNYNKNSYKSNNSYSGRVSRHDSSPTRRRVR